MLVSTTTVWPQESKVCTSSILEARRTVCSQAITLRRALLRSSAHQSSETNLVLVNGTSLKHLRATVRTTMQAWKNLSINMLCRVLSLESKPKWDQECPSIRSMPVRSMSPIKCRSHSISKASASQMRVQTLWTSTLVLPRSWTRRMSTSQQAQETMLMQVTTLKRRSFKLRQADKVALRSRMDSCRWQREATQHREWSLWDKRAKLSSHYMKSTPWSDDVMRLEEKITFVKHLHF